MSMPQLFKNATACDCFSSSNNFLIITLQVNFLKKFRKHSLLFSFSFTVFITSSHGIAAKNSVAVVQILFSINFPNLADFARLDFERNPRGKDGGLIPSCANIPNNSFTGPCIVMFFKICMPSTSSFFPKMRAGPTPGITFFTTISVSCAIGNTSTISPMSFMRLQDSCALTNARTHKMMFTYNK